MKVRYDRGSGTYRRFGVAAAIATVILHLIHFAAVPFFTVALAASIGHDALSKAAAWTTVLSIGLLLYGCLRPRIAYIRLP